MGVMSVVLRKVGGECGGEDGRSSGSLGSRKESGGMKTGLPR